MVRVVLTEEKELFASNEVAGDLPGDRWTCPGRFFCSLMRSLPSPLDALTGDLGAVVFPGAEGRRNRSRSAVLRVKAGWSLLGAALRSNLLAMSLTVPGREGSSTGWERTLVSVCELAGPEADRKDRDDALALGVKADDGAGVVIEFICGDGSASAVEPSSSDPS